MFQKEGKRKIDGSSSGRSFTIDFYSFSSYSTGIGGIKFFPIFYDLQRAVWHYISHIGTFLKRRPFYGKFSTYF